MGAQFEPQPQGTVADPESRPHDQGAMNAASGWATMLQKQAIIGALISLADHDLSTDDVAVLKESAPRLPDRYLRASLLCVRTARTLVPRYLLAIRGPGYLRRQPAPGHLESPACLPPEQSSD